MAASDAGPIPRKGKAYRVTVPILDADGDLVSGAAGLDSEVSKDGGTFADATNEATEIATSSGMYFLDLTATEMDADTVAVIVKTSTAGAKTTALVLNPAKDDAYSPDVMVRTTIATLTTQTSFTITDGSADDNTYNGMAAIITDVTTATQKALVFIQDYVGATKTVTLEAAPGFTIAATDHITILAAGSSDAGNAEVADAVWDEARSGHVTAGTFGEGVASVQGNVTGSAASVTGAVGSVAAGGITAASIATDAIDSDAIAASAVTEIQAGLSTLDAAGVRSAVGLASANLDTQLDALPTAVENADTLLDRNMATGTDSGSATVRTVRQALRAMRNKWSISAGTLTVTKEDDTTTSWTAAVTTSASDPVSTIDPADA